MDFTQYEKASLLIKEIENNDSKINDLNSMSSRLMGHSNDGYIRTMICFNHGEKNQDTYFGVELNYKLLKEFIKNSVSDIEEKNRELKVRFKNI